jgi:hypothetical protein
MRPLGASLQYDTLRVGSSLESGSESAHIEDARKTLNSFLQCYFSFLAALL